MGFDYALEKEIGFIPKNSQNRISVRRAKINGVARVDVRNTYCELTDTEFRPTKKGVNLSLAETVELIKLLQQAIDDAATQGEGDDRQQAGGGGE